MEQRWGNLCKKQTWGKDRSMVWYKLCLRCHYLSKSIYEFCFQRTGPGWRYVFCSYLCIVIFKAAGMDRITK